MKTVDGECIIKWVKFAEKEIASGKNASAKNSGPSVATTLTHDFRHSPVDDGR